MDNYTIYIDFRDGLGSVDYSSLLIGELEKEVILHNNYKHSTDELKVTLKKDTGLIDRLLGATEKGLAEVYKNSVPFFTGVVNHDGSFSTYEDVRSIEISMLDYSFYLEKKLPSSFVYKDYQVFNPSNTSTSFVHQMLYFAGFTDSDIQTTTTYSNNLQYVEGEKGKDEIVDILDDILYEYGFVFHFNELGKFEIINLAPDTLDVTNSFDYTNIIQPLTVNKKEEDNEGAKVLWKRTAEYQDVLLYRGIKDPEEPKTIPYGLYYPTEGNEKEVKQNLKPVIDGLDDPELLQSYNHNLDYQVENSAIIVDKENYWNKKAQILFHNTSSSTDYNLEWFDIRGDVEVISEKNETTKKNIVNTNYIEEYESKFIFNEIDAKRLANILASRFQYNIFSYSFKSQDDVNVGTIANLIDNKSGVNTTVRITKKTVNDKNNIIEYEAEGLTSYADQPVEEVINEPGNDSYDHIRDEIINSLDNNFVDKERYNTIEGVIVTNSDSPDTTIPITPTLSGYGNYKSIELYWDYQKNLINLKHYEVQVSEDGSNWYSLEFADGLWKKSLNEYTTTTTPFLVHTNIPNDTDTDGNAIGRTLQYRVRRRTKADAISSWDYVTVTSTVVDNGDIAANAITSNQIQTGTLNALVGNFSNKIYVGDTGYSGVTKKDTNPSIGDTGVYLDGDEVTLRSITNTDETNNTPENATWRESFKIKQDSGIQPIKVDDNYTSQGKEPTYYVGGWYISSVGVSRDGFTHRDGIGYLHSTKNMYVNYDNDGYFWVHKPQSVIWFTSTPYKPYTNYTSSNLTPDSDFAHIQGQAASLFNGYYIVAGNAQNQSGRENVDGVFVRKANSRSEVINGTYTLTEFDLGATEDVEDVIENGNYLVFISEAHLFWSSGGSSWSYYKLQGNVIPSDQYLDNIKYYNGYWVIKTHDTGWDNYLWISEDITTSTSWTQVTLNTGSTKIVNIANNNDFFFLITGEDYKIYYTNNFTAWYSDDLQSVAAYGSTTNTSFDGLYVAGNYIFLNVLDDEIGGRHAFVKNTSSFQSQEGSILNVNSDIVFTGDTTFINGINTLRRNALVRAVYDKYNYSDDWDFDNDGPKMPFYNYKYDHNSDEIDRSNSDTFTFNTEGNYLILLWTKNTSGSGSIYIAFSRDVTWRPGGYYNNSLGEITTPTGNWQSIHAVISVGVGDSVYVTGAGVWSIGTEITFVKLDGTKGPRGNKGVKGDTGDVAIDHQWDTTSLQLKNEDGTWGLLVDLEGPQGIQGEKGEKGDLGEIYTDHHWDNTSLKIRNEDGTWGPLVDLKGDPPNHEWDGSELRFQNPDGTWGIYTNLKGDIPNHEWSNTELRFVNPDGTWGTYTNLRGPVPQHETNSDDTLVRFINPDGTWGDWVQITAGSMTTFDGKTVDQFLRSDVDDSFTGSLLTIDNDLTVNGNLTASGGNVLTSSDEGSGNGLDADTVDGRHLDQDVSTNSSPIFHFRKLYLQNMIPSSDLNYDGHIVFDNSSIDGGLWVQRNGSHYKIFDEGNDGFGSGLDADTLTGYSGGDFLKSENSDTFNGNQLTIDGTLKINDKIDFWNQFDIDKIGSDEATAWLGFPQTHIDFHSVDHDNIPKTIIMWGDVEMRNDLEVDGTLSGQYGNQLNISSRLNAKDTLHIDNSSDSTTAELDFGYYGSNHFATIQAPTNRSLRFDLENNDTGDAFVFRYASGNDRNTDTVAMSINGDGSVDVNGTLSKNSGSFKIDHPLKPDTHKLVHSFIEGPKADLIYSGMVKLQNGKAVVNIDTKAGMTEGTFEALTRDRRRMTTNESGFTKVISSLSGNILTIEAEVACNDEVFWQVIGERKDDGIKSSAMADDEGNIIVEPLKEKVKEEEEKEKLYYEVEDEKGNIIKKELKDGQNKILTKE